jgi:hypothetical protein
MTWRARDRPAAAAAALGAAGGVKLFLWPLAVWLVATGRTRAAALSATLAVGSLVVIAPFAPLGEYADTLREVAARYDQDAYSWFGLLTRLGTGDLVARVVTYLAGALLLVLVWRRQSPTLAVAAALVLSPIVWLDFFALAAVPLAVARPTLSATWFVPLLTWGLPSSAIATDVWGVGRGLAVFAFVFAVAELGGSTTLASRRLGPS